MNIQEESADALALLCLGLRPELQEARLDQIADIFVRELVRAGHPPGSVRLIMRQIEKRIAVLEAAGPSTIVDTRQ
jgi:hypothetical protein